MSSADRSRWPLPNAARHFCRLFSSFACGALVVVSLGTTVHSQTDEPTTRQPIRRTSSSLVPLSQIDAGRTDFSEWDEDPLGPDQTFDRREPEPFPAAFERTSSASSASRRPLPLNPPSEAFALKRLQANVARSSESDRSDTSATTSKSRTSIPWGTTLFSLSVIIGLILLCAWVMKKIQPLKVQSLSTDVVEVLGKRPLDPRQQIFLIRCGSRVLLVGSSASGMSTLAEISDPEERDAVIGLCRKPTEESRLAQSFQSLLAKSNWWQGARSVSATAVKHPLSRSADAPLESRS